MTPADAAPRSARCNERRCTAVASAALLLFACVHTAIESCALRGPEAYDHAVSWARALPLAPALEALLVWLPLSAVLLVRLRADRLRGQLALSARALEIAALLYLLSHSYAGFWSAQLDGLQSPWFAARAEQLSSAQLGLPSYALGAALGLLALLWQLQRELRALWPGRWPAALRTALALLPALALAPAPLLALLVFSGGPLQAPSAAPAAPDARCAALPSAAQPPPAR